MPPKAADREGSRHPISFRTTAETRQKLEEAASRAGRSLTLEIEFRLEESLRNPLPERTRLLLETVGRAMSLTEAVLKNNWADDYKTRMECKSTATHILENIMNAGSYAAGEGSNQELADLLTYGRLGRSVANLVGHMVGAQEASEGDLAAVIKSVAGRAASDAKV